MSACRRLLGLLVLAALVVGAWTSGAAANGPPRSGKTWDGLYVGGSVGRSWGESGFVVPSGLTVTPNPMDLDGTVAGGVHLGFQRQWGSIVGGIETSALFANLGGRSLCPNLADFCTVEGNWTWMIGPRVGFVAGGMHFYTTGGYALGRLTSRAIDDATGVVLDQGHELHGGWYLGGGVEWNLMQNIIFGLEYRRIDLGGATHASSLGIPAAAREVDAEIDTIQARLSLKFGQ